MKYIIATLFVLLFLPSVYAISLGIPSVGEIIYEPNKEIVLEYRVHNDLNNALPVRAQLGVSNELSDYVTIDKHITALPAKGTEKVIIRIKFPEELPYGEYNVGFTVVENAAVSGAFVAHVGASHGVKILNPYPQGKASIEYKSPQQFPGEGTSNMEIGVRNIGRTDLEDIRVRAVLSNNMSTQETYSERLTIPALEGKNIIMPIKITVPPGHYTLQISTPRSDKTAEINLPVGNPTLKIDKITPFSAEHQSLEMTITNDWPEPFTATLGAQVQDPKDKHTLFEGTNLNTVINPGKNVVTLRLLNQGYLQNGLYPVTLQALSPPYLMGAHGELEVKLTELGQIILDQRDKEPEINAWEYQQVALDAPRVQKVAKDKQIFALVLVVAIAIFLFSLAMIFRKRREIQQNDTQKPETQPPTNQI